MYVNKNGQIEPARLARGRSGDARRRATRPAQTRGRLLLEVLEGRTLMTVQPTAVTLVPNPIEAIPFSNVIVATFISPGDPNATDFLAGSSIAWGDSSSDSTPATGLTIVSLGTTSAGPQFAIEGSHTYAETFLGKTLPVTVTIHDNVNGTDTLVVSSAPILDAPLSGSSPLPFAGVEGTALTSVPLASFQRASTNHSSADYLASIDWGDGTPIDPTGVISITPNGGGTPDTIGVSGSHDYAHKGTYNVTVKLTDHNTQTATVVNKATIHGATLTNTLTTTLDAVAGSPLTDAKVATFSDSNLLAGPGDFAASVSFDGTTVPGTVIQTASGAFAVLSSFTFPTPGSNLPVVTIILETAGATPAGDGPTTLTNTDAVTATVLAAPLILTATPIFATVGVALPTGTTPATGTLVGTFYNTAGAGTLSQYSATVDFGDGHGAIAAQIVASGPNYSIYAPTSPAVVYAKAGSFPVKTTLTDIVSGISASSTSAAVVVAAKLTLVGSIQTAPIYPHFTATTTNPLATITDADPAATLASYTVSINWGDGKVTPGSVADNAGQFVILGSHQYAAIGTYPVTISVTSTSGGSGSAVSTLTITDTPLVAGPPIVIQETVNKPFTAKVATFTSSNPASAAIDYSASIAWGDGTTSAGSVVKLADGSFAVVGSHTYLVANPGVPVPTSTTVQDSGIGGSSVVIPGSAIVYDANPITSPVTFTIPVDRQYTGPVATFLQTNLSPVGLQPGTTYASSIDWGDGTPPTSGTVVAIPGGFQVIGTHTYLNARTTANSNVFPVRVAIGDNMGNLTFVTSAATVTDAAFTAGLDPATDTGISPIDGFTTDQLPSFRGVAEAGATIKIFAQALGATTPTLVAVTTANGSGAWSTPTALLANAKYTITASEVDGSGNTLTTVQAIPNANQGMLVVDTLAPRVAGIIFSPKLGQFTVLLQGGISGLDIQSLANANNYVLQKGGKSYGSLLVTAIDPGNPSLPNDPARVTVTINNAKKLGGGTYTLVIHAGGIRSLAGAPLDGLYFGAFPSGVGIPGGNFVAQINFLHHKVSAPKTFIGTAKPIQASPPLPSNVKVMSHVKLASHAKVASVAPAQAIRAQSVAIPYNVQDAALESLFSTGTLIKKKKS